jgi:hypothetical protein
MSHYSIQGENCHGKLLMSMSLARIGLIPFGQLDAGQHPAYDGLAALPFYDDFDLSTVDVLLISQ